jgi:tRNA1(Val) A37 N6-methylase TrmN6
MNIKYFIGSDFLTALKQLFKELKVPINYLSNDPIPVKEILKDTYKNNSSFELVKEVYFLGMVDDAAFNENQSLPIEKIKSDYDGILIFGITLNARDKNLLPTRYQLGEISRAFNREFYYTPVLIVFQYHNDKGKFLALANTERLKYSQSWREGEKAGKVSLLRDININEPHSGHLRILKELVIPISGKKYVGSFTTLYNHWQDVFNVNILNKKFYQELQNWYFWAVKEVNFPNTPNRFDYSSEAKFDEAVKEHNGKNVIRLLTRILFIWFIKEKGLIPEEIFDEEIIKTKLLKNFTPQKPNSFFTQARNNSQYYRAILQNLFFATLNQVHGKREFRKKDKHQNVTNLMRYEDYFKDPQYFVTLMEETVPFMNGGLFECLDKPHETLKGKQGGDLIIYNDGFSDKSENTVMVPDYLFFDLDEEVDLTSDYGLNNSSYKKAKTRGLLEILKSYKFTINENTPVEEDVALDPELLGKVFENLLASYNPETKTTARKLTGSFYTPRDIVNYMVDESLIAYIASKITNPLLDMYGLKKHCFRAMLKDLISYDPINPFKDNPEIQKAIIKSLDNCLILDPACGSGAYPMGILQKIVHVLHKVDPNNIEWKQRQIQRVNNAITQLEEIDDDRFREQSIKELNDQIKDIEEAFTNNELDYGRKLYLIENCIYGVDIQPIATQISKLRFFISLVVDQKVDNSKENFGVRPLPNLETKFVAANTLVGSSEDVAQLQFYDTPERKILEKELKRVRHKLFSSKSPSKKRELRDQDKQIREKIAVQLEQSGWPSVVASSLSGWDPYDQNSSSPFFEPGWMFDVTEGFDIVIGNPPYKLVGADELREQAYYKKNYKMAAYKINLYVLFLENGLKLLKSKNGNLSFIIPKSLVFNTFLKESRTHLLSNYKIPKIVEITERVFENAEVGDNIIIFAGKDPEPSTNNLLYHTVKSITPYNLIDSYESYQSDLVSYHDSNFYPKPISTGKPEVKLGEVAIISNGLNPGNIKHILLSQKPETDKHKEMIIGKDIKKYTIKWSGNWVNYDKNLKNTVTPDDIRSKSGMTAQKKVDFALRDQKIYRADKIVIRKTSDHIIAAYDDFGYYYDSLAYGIQLKTNSSLSIFYILGLLNSTYMNFIHEGISLNKGKVFAKVLLKNLAELPIYQIDFRNKREATIHNAISRLVYINCYRTNESSKLLIEKIIDGLVFELYFEEHMKEKSINIFEYLVQHFRELNIDLSTLPDEKNEILDLAEKLILKLSNPDDMVQSRIKLFAIRSPEILRPYLDSSL